MGQAKLIKDKPSKDGTPKKSPCGTKCFVATVVALFLFLIFVALPGGILIIVHGRKIHNLGCIIGGAVLASTPALAIVSVCMGFFIRRRRRKSTGSVALHHQRV